MVPALFWHEEFDEKEKVVRGIGWGWYYRDEMPTRLLQDLDGITLLFGVSPEHVSCFLRQGDQLSGRQAVSLHSVKLWLPASGP